MIKALRKTITVALFLLPVIFISCFFLYPIAAILWNGLQSQDHLNQVTEVLRTPRSQEAIWFTFWQATISTVVTVLVALPSAALISKMKKRSRKWVRAAITVPFVLPTIVVAGAFEAVFKQLGIDSGPLSLHHTPWAIILAHVFFNYAVVARTVGSFWSSLDHRVEEQARLLGANKWQAFWQVTFPALKPAIYASAVITYLFSFTSFGIILVLGGPRKATIETEIYRYAITRSDFQSASSLALVQLIAVLFLIIVSTRLERGKPAPKSISYRSSEQFSLKFRLTNWTLVSMFLGGPILTLFLRSFSVGDGYGISHYQALASRVPQLPATALSAILNSLIFATVATCIALAVGILASLQIVHGKRGLRSLFDLGLTLPLGTSAVTIGFGILIALDEPPLDLRTSWWIVPIAHALIGTPFVIRTMVPALRHINPKIREVAATLGAAPHQVRRAIDLPIAMRGALVGAAFSFAVSIGEFGATSFLPRRPETLTAPIAMFRLLSTPGDLLRGQAMALSVILALIVATTVVVIESTKAGSEGSF